MGRLDEKAAAPSPSPSSDASGHAPALEDGYGEDLAQSETQNGLGPGYSAVHECAFVLVICMGQFLSLAALAQTIAPLHIISAYFGETDPGVQSWLTAGFSLGVGTFIMPAGRLGDMYGHRNMFVVGFLWFGLWSLVAGFSAYSNVVLLSAARGFQGVGPAIIVPNALAMLGTTYKMGTKKTMAFGMYAAAAPTGFFFGALFSSIFSTFAWWPWSFWAMAIACCAEAVAATIIIPADNIDDSHTECSLCKEELGLGCDERPQFDYLGSFTGVLGLILINFSWNQAAVVGWQEPYLYVLLVVGFILLGFFGWIELYVATQPLIPLRGLSKEAYLALACVSAGWGSFGLWTYYIWLLLEKIRLASPLLATAQTAPTIVSGIAASLVTGYLLPRVPVANMLLASFLFFITGMTLLATVPAHQTYWAQAFVSIVVMPWGMDISFPSGTVVLSNAMPKAHQGIAASLVNTVVNYSISMGLGFGGTILKNLDPQATHPFRDYHTAWYFGIGLDGLGLVIAAYFVWSHYWRPATAPG